MNEGVNYSGIRGDGAAALDPALRRFLEAFARIHGKVVVRQESGGLHAYFPSPIRLQLDGRKELSAMHGAMNLDKYFGRGKWPAGSFDRDDCAMCMKSGKRLDVDDLLNMPTIAERGIPELGQGGVHVGSVDNEKKLITDHLGRRVPGPPGEVTPLVQLPPDHPAVQYVVSRGFRLPVLNLMLEAAFCHRELPEGQLERFYRRGPDGWRDTPQNRLILYGRQDGSHIGWQGRLLQYEKDGYTYFLHPYRSEWIPVEHQAGDLKTIRPDYGDLWKKIARYKSADAMSRNESLFCLDAAVWWNQMMLQRDPNWVPTAVVCEGPLDAARFGPPAIGLTGKYISPSQMRLLAARFRRAWSLMDNDTGGDEAEEYFKQLGATMPVAAARPPKHRKDVGACNDDEIFTLRQQMLGVTEFFV